MNGFAKIGKDCKIYNVLILRPEMVELGDGVRIDDWVKIEGGTGLRVGNYVHIASFASILGGGRTLIGNYAGIAQGARIITGRGHPFADHFPQKPPAGDPYDNERLFVQMHDYSFVAANAVILPGTVIGEGAVIGAGSVASGMIKPWTIYLGSPAKPVKLRGRFEAR
jgi:galactoside O-acetyltransferase